MGNKKRVGAPFRVLFRAGEREDVQAPGFRAKYCTPDLTELRIHLSVPLNIRGTIPEQQFSVLFRSDASGSNL